MGRPQSAMDVCLTSLNKSCGCMLDETSSDKMSPCFSAAITISEQYQRGDIPKYVYDIGLGRNGDQYKKYPRWLNPSPWCSVQNSIIESYWLLEHCIERKNHSLREKRFCSKCTLPEYRTLHAFPAIVSRLSLIHI